MPKKIASTLLIEDLKKDVLELVKMAEKLREEEETTLRLKPSDDGWSVMECMKHLNLTAEIYVPNMEKKIQRALGEQQTAGNYFTSSVIGEYMVNSMKPKEDGSLKRRMKTFQSLDPRKINRGGTKEIATFILYQKRILAMLDLASQVNLNANKVESALGKIIKFKLGNAFRFLIAHQERHMIQAQRALAKVKA